MKIYTRRFSNYKLSLIITCIYVGLGTIYGLTYWTGISADLNEDLWSLIFYFFAPCAFLEIGILFTERNPAFLIAISQSITFFMMWGLIYVITYAFRKDSKSSDN